MLAKRASNPELASQTGIVAHTCNPSTLEIGEDYKLKVIPALKRSLGYRRPCLVFGEVSGEMAKQLRALVLFQRSWVYVVPTQ